MCAHVHTCTNARPPPPGCWNKNAEGIDRGDAPAVLPFSASLCPSHAPPPPPQHNMTVRDKSKPHKNVTLTQLMAGRHRARGEGHTKPPGSAGHRTAANWVRTWAGSLSGNSTPQYRNRWPRMYGFRYTGIPWCGTQSCGGGDTDVERGTHKGRDPVGRGQGSGGRFCTAHVQCPTVT